MRLTALILGLCLFFSCSKTKSSAGQRHYALSGKITELDKAHQAASIDAAAMPGFMEAMTMEYPIASKAEFETLRVGEQIVGMVDVGSDGEYSVSGIREGKSGSTH